MDEREPGSSTLPDTLGTIPSLLKGRAAQTDPEARGSYARKQLPALFQGAAEAETQAKMGEFERDQETIRKTAEAERDLARGTRMETEKLESGLQQRGVFEAPQYKASDYAANSATRLLTAVLLGGIARTSATGQLQAIKSMQDAEEKGLMADFEAARMRFDELEKQRQDNNKMLRERFDRMIDLLGKDRNAALVEAKLIEGNLGKGIIANLLRSGNHWKAYELFNKDTEAEDKIRLEKTKAALKGEEPGRLGEADKKAMRNVGDVKSTLDRVGQSSRPDFFGIAPADFLAKAIMDLEERGVEIPERVWNQLASKGVDADTVAWWKDYYAYVAEVRNKLFGATLTPREAGDFRNFTISPATSYDVVQRFFQNQNKVIREKAQRELEIARSYRVPDRVSAAYLRMPEILEQPAGADRGRQPSAGGPRPPAFASEAEANAAFRAGTIQVGDEITVGGRRAIYEQD